MTTALIFDTETSGLVANRTLRDDRLPEIIEIYLELVDLTNGTVIDEYEQLIKPTRPLPEEVIKITHITDEILADKPSFKDVADKIITMIESAPVVIAHNMTFDLEMLEIESTRIKRLIKWPRLICSVESTVHLTGKRLTLGKLHEHLFNMKFTDAHRAKNDVKALTRCCIQLYKDGDLL